MKKIELYIPLLGFVFLLLIPYKLKAEEEIKLFWYQLIWIIIFIIFIFVEPLIILLL